jgi:hypothetical protein
VASNLIERICVGKGHALPRLDTAPRTPTLGSTVVMVDGLRAYCRAAAITQHEWRAVTPGLTVADAAGYVQREAGPGASS